MRLYVPATLADLAAPDLTSRPASAVTPALRAALVDEDEEGLEMSAFLTAADLAVLRLADGAGPWRRVVLALEVADAVAMGPVAADLAHLPSLVGELPVTPWGRVVSIHVDEPEAEERVRAALDDDDAYAELAEVDLLWFDPSERAALLAD